MNSRPTLAVILPVLNEEKTIHGTLASLAAQTEPAERIVLVDGGSSDRTVAEARSLGAEVCSVTQRGRGTQIAAGLAITTEEIVLVAHADMRFPAESLGLVRSILATSPDCPGGCLGHTFESPLRVFRLIEWLDKRRARRGMSYGDQAQFFRRQLVEQHGGFPAIPFMEDVVLSQLLLHLGVPAYLDCPVTVSTRRYERHGVLRVAWENWRLRQSYLRCGDSACRTIYQRYYASVTDVPTQGADT